MPVVVISPCFSLFPYRLPVYSPWHTEGSPVLVQAQKGLHVVFTQLKVEHLKEKEQLSNSRKPSDFTRLNVDVKMIQYESSRLAERTMSKTIRSCFKIGIPGNFPWSDGVLLTWAQRSHFSGCGTWWEPGGKYYLIIIQASSWLHFCWIATQYCTV